MIKISDINDFGIKGCRDLIALVRELAILCLVVFLIFNAMTISSDKFKNIVHTLKKSGVSELNIAGNKVVLSAKDTLEESTLEMDEVAKYIDKVKVILKEKEPNIKNAIALIDDVGKRLESTQEEMRTETVAIKNADIKPQPVSQGTDQWVVIVGSDVTFDAANYERKNLPKEFNAKIIFNKNRFRTVILYNSEQEAKANLQDIKQKVRQDSYARPLSTWCKTLVPSKDGKYEDCT